MTTGKHGAVIHGASTSTLTCQQLGPGGLGSAPCLAAITIKSSHVTVQSLKVTGGIGAGIHLMGVADSVVSQNFVVAGVYSNTIAHNTITNNGTRGEGAGVLFANAAAGTASYDNLVEFNNISGNELSGVTMHAHTLAPGSFEDLSGNRIVHSRIAVNNAGGDPLDGSASDTSTTGILVFSASIP